MRALFAAVLATLSLLSCADACEPIRRGLLPEGAAGFSENPLIEARVRLSYNDCGDDTDIHIRVDGLLPGTTYGVLWFSDLGVLDIADAFTTDSEGEGRYARGAGKLDDFGIGVLTREAVFTIYADLNRSGDMQPGEELARGFAEN